MNASARTLLVLAGLVLAGCSSPSGRAPAQDGGGAVLSWSFGGTPGALPAGWRVGTTNARGAQDARWELRSAPDAPSPPGALVLVDARGHGGSSFNLCWRPEVSRADVEVEVAVRAGGGAEDRGGGPAWRIADADDYYVARWNPLEENFRVYSVVGGRRVQLDGADARVDPDAWHVVRVRHVGRSITCWLDGRELLHAEDAELEAAGGVGVWTKADATTSFDDLVVRPALLSGS